MKKKPNIFSVLFLITVIVFACSSLRNEHHEPETEEKPKEKIPENNMAVLAVDFTTNKFMGGYFIPLESATKPIEIDVDYKAPSDFGWISLYEKSTRTKLFTGDILWGGGCGERTFPKEIFPANLYTKSKTKIPMPEIIRIVEDPYFSFIDDWITFTYNEIWTAVNDLEIVHGFAENSKPFQVFAYLYLGNIGLGNQNYWYWLLFIF